MGDAKGHLPLWMTDTIELCTVKVALLMSLLLLFLLARHVARKTDVFFNQQSEPALRISFKTEAFTFKVYL